jgi:hypothetical protein
MNPVAVEKLARCLQGILTQSFVERFPGSEFFNSHALITANHW